MLQSRRGRLVMLIGAGIVLAVLLMSTIDFRYDSFSPRAFQGVLDLRQWNPNQDGPVRLDGSWDLYWQRLLTETRGETPMLVKVPGEWKDSGLPGRGFATYKLTVLTRGDTGKLALRVPAIAPAYRILINGRVIAETGIVAADPKAVRAGYLPKTVSFVPPGPSFDLYIQVANELYPSGGIWFSLTLGTEASMLALKQRTEFADMAVFGGAALLGLYQIALFLMRRSERSNLYFGICCLLGAVRTGAVGGMYIAQLYPHTDIRLLIMLEYLTYYGGVTAALLFVRELYPKEFHPVIVRLFSITGCVFIGTVLLLPAEWFTQFIGIYKYISLAILIFIVYGSVMAWWRKREGAVLQLSGWVAFGIAAFHDIAYSSGRILWTDVQLVSYGFILLVFIEALEIARRFTNAYRVIGRMSEQLMASNRLKDEFLANTSHELKTPLHGIMNLSLALAEGKSGELNGKQREQLEVVIAVARRLSNLINDILDLSQLKHSGIQLERRSVDIRAVVMAQQEIFRHYIGGKPVRLRFDWPEILPYVHADEGRLLQIVYNLIGNAIKFTPAGEVSVTAWAEGDSLHVAVADTGIGIAADKLETIFQSFEQIGTFAASEYGGIGLGLGIAKKLIELHGGRISVSSQVGRGSVFTIALPVSGETAALRDVKPPSEANDNAMTDLYQTTCQVEAAAALDSASDSGSRKAPCILAVDDDPVNLLVLQTVLADEPYPIITASSGEEAMEKLDELGGRIGLVILDVMMPGQSGYETCRQIRQTYPLSELPILLTTVRSEPSDVMFGFGAGANDYLTKPFQAYELRARARTLLAMKRSAEDAVRSELAFLQAQIKPHFLYNTLNTIITFSLEDPQMTHDLLLHLGKYLRGSFDFQSKERLVTLRKELELAEAYLQIERARFGERLRIRIELEEATDCMLPPLILQPLVENAVRHGIMTQEDGGTVTISASVDAGCTRLSVEDDGVGMPSWVPSILEKEEAERGGVGLRNIHQRLLRMFGTGLEIEAGSAGGTKISLRIPQAAHSRKEEAG